ncbi:hypothetical protein BT67DRAFT_494168 [Trichocladium antarcticum]|uniref:Uncharacterized protein n=1 Tax=Trichocladium antarcticum TaxID=1450529 RepID=A0AAN6ULK4_9PEZI|nr:hypothetical protein BT67DRAFT_494168 [Trichocladium antarcticum]
MIEFSGSSFDGIVESAIESARLLKEPLTVRTDRFALGSTIYETVTSRQPYEDLADDEVEARHSQQTYISKRHSGISVRAGEHGLLAPRDTNRRGSFMIRLKVEMESVGSRVFNRHCFSNSSTLAHSLVQTDSPGIRHVFWQIPSIPPSTHRQCSPHHALQPSRLVGLAYLFSSCPRCRPTARVSGRVYPAPSQAYPPGPQQLPALPEAEWW